jgi:hypothetical protein
MLLHPGGICSGTVKDDIQPDRVQIASLELQAGKREPELEGPVFSVTNNGGLPIATPSSANETVCAQALGIDLEMVGRP